MAQGTMGNVCEFYITKMDILSFVTPKYRTLVPAIGLIYILQLGRLDESFFFFFAPCHSCCQHYYSIALLQGCMWVLQNSHADYRRKDIKSTSGVTPLQDFPSKPLSCVQWKDPPTTTKVVCFPLGYM